MRSCYITYCTISNENENENEATMYTTVLTYSTSTYLHLPYSTLTLPLKYIKSNVMSYDKMNEWMSIF